MCAFMRKKRIRFFISTLSGGGAESVLINALAFLEKVGKYEITLQTIVGGEFETRIPDGVNYRCILAKAKNPHSLMVKMVYKLPLKLFCAMFLRGEYDYEVAYLEGRPTRFMSKKKTNGKKITFVHCDLAYTNPIMSLYKSKTSCLNEYRHYDAVCFVSGGARKSFEKTIGVLDNACVVHNIIDNERIQKLSCVDSGKLFSSKGLKLVAVGRLVKEKNFGMLVSVVGELAKSFDLELLIIGEGPERKALESEIQEKNIQCIKLLGYMNNPYVAMKQADLLVCSSKYEGYSMVVCEAITLGVPVIATDCAAMNEILDNGRYGMITENSHEGLLTGLKAILSDPAVLEEYSARLKEYRPDSISQQEYTELFAE